MMKLFSAAWCTYCTPVKQLIEDDNMPVEIIDVDVSPELVAKFGIRGIPALEDDGIILTESKVIEEYLIARFQ